MTAVKFEGTRFVLEYALSLSSIPWNVFVLVFKDHLYIKIVTAVTSWRKSVVFLVSIYNYGETSTDFENLKTASRSAHHSGPSFVNIWKGYSKKCFFLLPCVINAGRSMCFFGK